LDSPYVNSQFFYAFKTIYKYYSANEYKIAKHTESDKILPNDFKINTKIKSEKNSMINYNKSPPCLDISSPDLYPNVC
jgi:hypothetical protein